METVGIYLKKEREANNISLREVAQITKITATYLENIEKNEFDKIPQGPYIKGYLSSYSRAIGCDVDTIINLYESANSKRIQAEAIQPVTASIDGGKHSADQSQTKGRNQPSGLRLGNLRSWCHTLESLVAAKSVLNKAAEKKIAISDAVKANNRKPFRHRFGLVQQSGFSVTIRRWSTDRGIWMYACIALCGAFILFLAGVGFDHLFLSEPAKSNAAFSGPKPEADISAGMSGPATQIGAPSSDSASTTQPVALLGNNADVESMGPTDRQPSKSDPSPKPSIVDASLTILQATICRAIENRMPAGVDRSFTTSDGKIYVWTQIEAKQVPATIHHIYYFGGKKIRDVSLDVRSAHWRTWSSKTIANRLDRGEWRVDIATSNGDILRRLYFEVN
ncbi:DUF2914 domain-containing protein [Desulfosarcina sp.]|uniref:DUF2914 domain-containing protein n=1 Tax=Desulfosarcina sp. TaxID=2027861 RepID=UPI003970EAB2